MLLSGGQVDFIVVGEPAATAQTKRLSLNAEMNIQTEYSKVSGATSFPQAGIFVNQRLQATKLLWNRFWGIGSQQRVGCSKQSKRNRRSEKVYESANFPAIAIDRCAINGAKLTEESMRDIMLFLSNVMPKDSKGNSIDWTTNKSKIFDIPTSTTENSKQIKFPHLRGLLRLLCLHLRAMVKNSRLWCRI